MKSHHPATEWLLDHAAGRQKEPDRMVMAIHLENCPACCSQLARWQQLGAGLLEALPPSTLADDALAITLARARHARAAPPAPPRPLRERLLARMNSLSWTRGSPAYRVAPVLADGGAHALLVHIRPGGRLPVHTHCGHENTVILRGAFSDGYGRYDAGDVVQAGPEHEHDPVASRDEDCVCLAALDAPPRLTGPMLRMLNPLVRRMFG